MARQVSPALLYRFPQGKFQLRIATTLVEPLGTKTGLNINISNAAGETVSVGYDWSQGQVYVNRGQTTGFINPYFTNEFAAWESNEDNSIEFHVLVDRSILEVFVNGGVEVCTSSFFMQLAPPRKCS